MKNIMNSNAIKAILNHSIKIMCETTKLLDDNKNLTILN